jgi:hypothetical protein
MGVGRYAVPDITGIQLGQTHGQLAGLQNIGVDELVDDTLVGSFNCAERTLVGILDGDKGGLAILVCRSGDNIESGGIGCIIAAKKHGLGASGDVKAVLKAKLKTLTVALNVACAAKVENAGFSSLEEELGAKVCPDVNAVIDGKLLLNRHNAQHYHAVNMGVGSLNGVGLIKIGDKEFLAELLGGVSLYIVGMCGITNIHDYPF